MARNETSGADVVRPASRPTAAAEAGERRSGLVVTRALTRVLAAAMLAGLSACDAPQPDILVVTLDTLRRDHVGAYGDRRGLTPNLDRLAESGLVHDAAFTTMPTTGPAHLSLFTGLYPSALGTTRNTEALTDRHAARELASLLAARGYATGAFVTSVAAGPLATGLRGFEIYPEPTSVLVSSDIAVTRALEWLSSVESRPVFLWVHIYDPHSPYGDVNQKRVSMPLDPRIYGWIDPELFASGDVASRVEGLYRMGVQSADAALGRLLTGVRELRGQGDAAAIVIVAADHGESLREHMQTRGYAFDHGEFLDPETVRIPLVLSGPGVGVGRSTAAASLRDLYTTILEAAGLGDPSAAAEGRRDLRTPSSKLRIVEIERRSFSEKQPTLVEGHYGGASDGARIVVAGPEGRPTSGAEGASQALIEAASRRAKEAAQAALRAPPDFSPDMIRALKSLGYAQ
jgi:hypothetical protein